MKRSALEEHQESGEKKRKQQTSSIPNFFLGGNFQELVTESTKYLLIKACL